MKMSYFLLEMGKFSICYVSLPEGIWKLMAAKPPRSYSKKSGIFWEVYKGNPTKICPKYSRLFWKFRYFGNFGIDRGCVFEWNLFVELPGQKSPCWQYVWTFFPGITQAINCLRTHEFAKHHTETNTYRNQIHPVRLTWNLRIHPWKRKVIFQTIIFRFYINLGGCNKKTLLLGHVP